MKNCNWCGMYAGREGKIDHAPWCKGPRETEVRQGSSSEYPFPGQAESEITALRNKIARLESELAEARKVPEGWMLVPVVPTPKMVCALWEHRDRLRGHCENRIAEESYAAMLAAAPQPPAVAREDV